MDSDRDLEIARELHKKVVRKFEKRKIITKGIDDLWAADLLILDKYKKENNGQKYLLVVIDTFSKYLFAEPLKDKSGVIVATAFKNILKKSKRTPKLLHVDRGKEFVNKNFEKVLDEYGIKMYHTFNEEKSSIAERVNRTLNQKFRIYFEINKNHCWVKVLGKILKEYNEVDIHRTIGRPPATVNESNEKEILQRLYPLEDFKRDKPVFSIGNRVRIFRKKKQFSDKYSSNWTEEIFTIKKIHLTNPITYTIQDSNNEIILGKFYKQELQKTKF
ncbi:hypothetical protein V9T40_005543 [Parthenolecanium corni]|uniref:Integrase catalytic domain-containing protein n=1 Tax=Parthenolecanium corni TaxID=536013 RepID=A0AAN9TT27_9HEMI